MADEKSHGTSHSYFGRSKDSHWENYSNSLRTSNYPNDQTSSQPATTSWSTTVNDSLFEEHSNYSFSTRNSFRTFGLPPTSKGSGRTPNQNQSSDCPFEIGFKKQAYYVSLTQCDWFVREVGSFYYCTLCGKRARIQDGMTIPRHLESQMHSERYIKLKSDLWDLTPTENSLQMHGISKLLDRWLTKSLSEDDKYIRYGITQQFEMIVKMINPECSCRVLGSLRTNTSLKDSDINIELLHPNSEFFESDPRAKTSVHHQLIDPDAELGLQINMHTMHFDLIPNAVDTLYKIAKIIEQRYSETSDFVLCSDISDLNSKIPKLKLIHMVHNCTLEIVCYADSSYRLSEMLRIYLMLDPRARDLSILVKYWANICKISNPDAGSYPPEAYIVMIIYYLQRTSPPILPCIHEMYSRSTRVSRSDNSESEPDEPSTTNGFNEDNCSTDQCQDDEEVEDEDDSNNNVEFIEENLNVSAWSSQNTQPTHVLFIDFLQTMSREFDNTADVISIRTLKPVQLRNKPWKTSVKAIEHPMKPKNNLSMTVGSLRTFSYIRQCFKQSYYYLTSVPLTANLSAVRNQQPHPEEFIQLYIEKNNLEFYFKMKEKSFNKTAAGDTISEMIRQNIFARDVEVIRRLLDQSGYDKKRIEQLPFAIANGYKESLMAPRNSLATSYCWLCRSNGHEKKECKKGTLEDLKYELQHYREDLDSVANIDHILLSAYKRDIIGPELAKQHKLVVNELTTIIKQEAGVDCVLKLYGSTVNNLGSSDSDLDICMTLTDDPIGRNVDCVVTLQKVQDALLDHSLVKKLEPRFSARVPILKFDFKGFDIDLSMYNQCAIYNSRLLKKYSTLDERVAPLIYLVKKYAKACQIADASRGSLSSYAWCLMVIHFLQNTSPPILPVLQEPEKGQVKPTFGVNGWNVWFRKDIKTSKCQNQFSITQLFKQFFLYYANFEFHDKVITIRKRGTLSKFTKNWHNCMMAIEDPFELTYNLASRLDNPMAIYIINSLAKAYRHFVALQEEYASDDGQAMDRFMFAKLFDGHQITRSTPPFRGCRICHRIGHCANKCPDGSINNISKNQPSARKPQ